MLSSGLPGTLVTVTSEFGIILGEGHVPAQGTMNAFGNCAFEVPIELAGSADYYTLDLGERFGSLTIKRSAFVGRGGDVLINLSSQ